MDDDATGQDIPPESDEGEQPQETAQEQSDTEATDQGLIAKYLDGLDPEIRGIVAQRLETQRKDQDRHANKKIADLSSQVKSYEQVTGSVDTAKFLGTLYQGLVTQPVETMQWIIDEYKQDDGRDLWKELLAVMQPETTEPAQAPEPEAPSDKDLKAELEAYVESKLAEAEKAMEQKRVSAAELDEARQRANGWLADAATRHKLPMDDGDRNYILQQASALIDSGTVTSGQEAIDLATENLSKRLKDLSRKRPLEDSLKVAKGGNGTAPAAPDLSSPKTRREAGLAILQHERD